MSWIVFGRGVKSGRAENRDETKEEEDKVAPMDGSSSSGAISRRPRPSAIQWGVKERSRSISVAKPPPLSSAAVVPIEPPESTIGESGGATDFDPHRLAAERAAQELARESSKPRASGAFFGMSPKDRKAMAQRPSIVEEGVSIRLASGFATARAMRRRVSGLTLLVGTLPCFFCQFMFHIANWEVVSWMPAASWLGLGIPMGYLMLVSVLPTDRFVIRCLVFVAINTFMGTAAVWGLHAAFSQPAASSLAVRIASAFNALIFVVTAAILAPAFIPVASKVPWCSRAKWRNFRIPARGALARIWIGARVSLALMATIHCIGQLVRGVGAADSVGAATMAVIWILASMATTLRNRQRLVAWLQRIGIPKDAITAASIAALVSKSKDVNSIIEVASERFRAISVDDISVDDLTKSEDTGVGEKAVNLPLGDCNAFFSHSWRDDGVSKHEVLTSWAASWHRKTGKLPNVWLDKGSIDQTNIDEDLACLPIFLAGCQYLLVFAGPTYIYRLWW